MSDVTLVLGPVVFQDFEVPSRIGFGGDQRLAVHDLPGGIRVTDTLGAIPQDIAWDGIFSGPDATLRARLLDALRGQASVLTLSWDVFFYSVVIREFEAEYRNTAWVPYRLRCSVLQDPAGAEPQLADALLSDVIGDAGIAGSLAALGGLSITALQASLALPGAASVGTQAALGALAALGTAQAQVSTGLAQANTALDGDALGLASAGDVTAMIGDAGQAATLATSNAFLGRVAANFADGGI